MFIYVYCIHAVVQYVWVDIVVTYDNRSPLPSLVFFY